MGRDKKKEGGDIRRTKREYLWDHTFAYVLHREVECVYKPFADSYYEYACTLFDGSQMCVYTKSNRHEKRDDERVQVH